MSVQLTYDSKNKKLLLDEKSSKEVPQLQLEIDQLNVLTQELIANGADVPAPPTPETFNQDMAKMINKLYNSAAHSFMDGKYEESVKQFSIGIDMITRRRKFEPFQGTLHELSMFLMGRCDAFLKVKDYMSAYNDADMLIGMMICSADNFLRRAVASWYMGNYAEARADYQRGLSFDPNNERLMTELGVCLDMILKENADEL